MKISEHLKVGTVVIVVVAAFALGVIGWEHHMETHDKELYRSALETPLKGNSYARFKTLISALHKASCGTSLPAAPTENPDYNAGLKKAKGLLLQAANEGDARAFQLIYDESSDETLSDEPFSDLGNLASQDVIKQEAIGGLLRAAELPKQEGIVYELAGSAYADGVNTTVDYERALHYYEQAWLDLDLQASTYMANVYRTIGDPTDAYLWAVRAKAYATRRSDTASYFEIEQNGHAIKAMDACPGEIIPIQKLAADPHVLKVPASFKCPAAAPLLSQDTAQVGGQG